MQIILISPEGLCTEPAMEWIMKQQIYLFAIICDEFHRIFLDSSFRSAFLNMFLRLAAIPGIGITLSRLSSFEFM